MPRFSLTMRTNGFCFRHRRGKPSTGPSSVTPGLTKAVRRRQRAAHQVDRGHRQVHVCQPQFLDHLGGVAVAEGREGADHAAALGVVRAGVGLRAAFGRADLDLNNHRFCSLEQPGLDQWVERQVAGGGIAAHPADIAARVFISARCSSGRP